MPHNRPVADALAILELLSIEAPPERFEALLTEAKRHGLQGAALEHLEEATRLGVTIQAQYARRNRKEAGLATLIDAAADLLVPLDPDSLLQAITRRARLLLGLDMSYIGLPDSDGSTICIRASDGHTSILNVGLRLPNEGGLGRGVLEAPAPFWTPDYLTDERFPHSEIADHVVESEGLRAMMVVPLNSGTETFGVLYVANRSVRHFTADEISLMSRFCDLAGVAVERVRHLRRERLSLVEDGLASARELHALHTRLVTMALAGSDLQSLAQEASSRLGGAISVEAPTGSMLTAVGGTISDETRAAVARGAIEAHAARGPVPVGDGAWATPIVAGSEGLATLLLHSGRPLEEGDETVLLATAQAMALVLLQDNSRTAMAEGRIRDELLDDLLFHPQRPLAQLEKRARQLGLDLRRPHVMVIARPEGNAEGKPVLWAASYALRLGGLKSWHDGCVVLLLPGSDASAIARAVSAELAPLLDCEVTVGASGPVSVPGALYDSYQEAQRCLDAMTALGAAGQAASFRELGFLGVLLSDHHDVGGFIDEVIGPVLRYDRQRLTELVRTLEAYFEAGASQIHAAKLLHVHPNTVARRLERIGDLLGPDWQKPAKALEVQLALRLSRVKAGLQQDAPGM